MLPVEVMPVARKPDVFVGAVTPQEGGKLAQVGSRLIDGVAKKMAEDFFRRFKDTVAPVPAEIAAVIAHPEVQRRGVPHWAWIALAIAVAIVIALFAFRAH